MDFETRSIYALADLFKSLSTNEHYDLAQRLYARWLQEEEDAYERKMRALVNTYGNLLRQEKRQFFSTWQTVTQVAGQLAEKDRHNAALQNEVERLSMEVDLLTSDEASRQEPFKRPGQMPPLPYPSLSTPPIANLRSRASPKIESYPSVEGTSTARETPKDYSTHDFETAETFGGARDEGTRNRRTNTLL